jgi:quinol monooxygenase YgiN
MQTASRLERRKEAPSTCRKAAELIDRTAGVDRIGVSAASHYRAACSTCAPVLLSGYCQALARPTQRSASTRLREVHMITVFVHHRVADYDVWRPEFDRTTKADWAKDLGGYSYRVWRGQDDPNLVIVSNTFESREAADAAMNDPTLREAMARGGVILSSVRVDVVNEVTAGATAV